MAPTVPLRTYSRRQILHRRNSVDVFDALFAENICKRKQAEVTKKKQKRKKTIKIKELPPPDENHHLMHDSFSTSWGVDDTFDKLRKDTSPKQVKNTKLESTDHLTKQCSNSEQPLNRSNNQINSKPERTLDKSVNFSLFVEKITIKKPEISTLSSLSSINDHTSQNSKVCHAGELSYEPMFSQSFRNQQSVKLDPPRRPVMACSTPQKVPLEISMLSPIFHDMHQKSLIEKSYEEIKKWNFKPPDFESLLEHSAVPKVKKKPYKLNKVFRKKKRLTSKVRNKVIKKITPELSKKVLLEKYDYRTDWKLKEQPKVVIENNLDILGITKSVKISSPICAAEGFAASEYVKSVKNVYDHNNVTSDFQKTCEILQPNLNSDTEDSPVRYVTLRKRSIKKGIKPNPLKTDLELNRISHSSSKDKRSTIKGTYTESPLSKGSDAELEMQNTNAVNCNSSRIKDMQGNVNEELGTFTESSTNVRRTKRTSNSVFATFKKAPIKIQNPKSKIFDAIEEHSKETISSSTDDKLPSSLEVEVSDNSSKANHQSSSSQNIVRTQDDEGSSIDSDVIPETPPEKSKSVKRTKYLFKEHVNLRTEENMSLPNSNTSNLLELSNISLRTENVNEIHLDDLNDSSVVLEYHNYSKKPSGTEIIDLVSSDETDCESSQDSSQMNISTSSNKKSSSKFKESLENSKIDQSKNEHISKEPLMFKLGKSWKSSLLKPTVAPEKPVAFVNTTIINLDSSDDEVGPDFAQAAGQLSSNQTLMEEHKEVNTTKRNKKQSHCELSSLKHKFHHIRNSLDSLPDALADSYQHSRASLKTVLYLTVKPGKQWRRSLLSIRKSIVQEDETSFCSALEGCGCSCSKCQQKSELSRVSIQRRRLSFKIVPEAPLHKVKLFHGNTTILENYATTILNETYGSNTNQISAYQEESARDSTVLRTKERSIHESEEPILSPSITARDIVLQRCGQTEPIPFEKCYPPTSLKNCFKIGEGVYGEVFLFRNPNGTSSVMKVIPIEGSQMVNGEHQKKFSEILSEVIIAMELSNLRNGILNSTSGFSEVEKIRCVQGSYPVRLLELWELYDENRGTENDSPEIFKDDQLYIVLELANAGLDMEAFVFTDAMQTFSLFKQISCSLAVAEESLQFEHRDLHWGNILMLPSDEIKQLKYCINGQNVEVETCGIVSSIIDFTLSRVTYNGVCIFNDLGSDPDLFTATGDYQFKIYRKMQKKNGNEWQHFEPYTNILWLHYVLDKMTSEKGGVRYNIKDMKRHKEGLSQLRQIKLKALQYSSATELVAFELM